MSLYLLQLAQFFLTLITLARAVQFLRLTAPASPPTIPALIATPIPCHDRPALSAQRGVLDRWRPIERQRLLRIGLRRTQRQRLADLTHGVLGAEELRAEPAEDVIHDRLRIRN